MADFLKMFDKNSQDNDIHAEITKIKQKLEVNPNSIAILSQLAEKYNLSGQYKRAIGYCDKILKDGKKFKPAYNNLFYAYDMLEEFDNGLKVLKIYLNSFHLVVNPELHAYSYSVWAERYYKKKIKDLPLYLNNLPFNKPSDVIDINFSTSFTFSRIGWSERSTEVCLLILEFYPENIEFLIALSSSYILKGQYKEARESLDKVLSIAQDNFKAQVLFGSLYRKTGKYSESETIYNRLIQNLNDVNFPLNDRYQIQLYVNEDNVSDVMNLFKVYTGLGLLYNETGEYEQAIEQLSKVLNFYKRIHGTFGVTNPALTLIYLNLGIAYQALDYRKSALKIFKKALRNDPKSIEVLASLGELYFDMEKYKHAIETLQHVVGIEPENYLAWHVLSKSHYKKGEIKFATEANTKCLNLDSKFESALKFRDKLSHLQ